VVDRIAIGAGNIELDLPAGPFVRVEVLGLKAELAGNDLTGDFYFDQVTLPDNTKVTRFAVANASITVSGNGIQNAEGAFLVKTTGFAGQLSGDISISAGGVSAGGRAGFRINTTGATVDESFEFGGRMIALKFGAGEFSTPAGTPYFNFFAENLVLNIGNFVTIEGSVNFVNANGRSTFAGTAAER
jgi:hypothetical protein